MADQVLVLWLCGPMQSWGTRARWDVRDTALEPTKSGIVGLLGCALGIPRGHPELEALDDQVRFAVRTDRPGVVSTDYHTVTGYHRTAAGGFKHSGGVATTLKSALAHGPSTIVSPRDYLHDAAFMVAISAEDALANRLREALMNPKWPLFLGRKSCLPVRPILDATANAYNSLEEALQLCPRYQEAMGGPLSATIEDPAGLLERQDALRVNPLRMYDFRRSRFMKVDPPCSSPE